MDKHIIGDIVFYKHISNKTDLDERMSDIDSSFTHLFVMSPDKGSKSLLYLQQVREGDKYI